MAFRTASYWLNLSALETMNTILYFIALIPPKSLLLPSGSHIVSCFSARAENPSPVRAESLAMKLTI